MCGFWQKSDALCDIFQKLHKFCRLGVYLSCLLDNELVQSQKCSKTATFATIQPALLFFLLRSHALDNTCLFQFPVSCPSASCLLNATCQTHCDYVSVILHECRCTVKMLKTFQMLTLLVVKSIITPPVDLSSARESMAKTNNKLINAELFLLSATMQRLILTSWYTDKMFI